MKNYTTPRTLAQCEFTVGHREAQLRREFSVSSWVILLLALVALGLFLMGVIR